MAQADITRGLVLAVGVNDLAALATPDRQVHAVAVDAAQAETLRKSGRAGLVTVTVAAGLPWSDHFDA